jgi:hypothetical protein
MCGRGGRGSRNRGLTRLCHRPYTFLQALEDRWWGEQAKLAEQRGFLGVEETARALAALQPPEDEDTC